MVAINALANDIIRFYDKNRDGRISLESGRKFEAERLIREVQHGFDYDEVTLTRYSHESLFRAADKNGDNQITHQELIDLMSPFDTNHDNELTNKGPFWNRKGELKNFEKAHPEEWEIVDRWVIPHPQHPYPGYPYGDYPLPVGDIYYAQASRTVGVQIG